MRRKFKVTPSKPNPRAEKPKTLDPFKRTIGKRFYHIDQVGEVRVEIDKDSLANAFLYERFNYCTDEELMVQLAYKELLRRQLWKFSMSRGGKDIDWNNFSQAKYGIFWDNTSDCFRVEYTTLRRSLEQVYFISKETAQKAIDGIVNPFIINHPDFKF